MKKPQTAIKKSRFPVSLLVIFFLVLLLMSGIHIGLLVLSYKSNWNKLVQTIIPMIYWFLVALGLTLFTCWRVKRSYEIPMQNLARATSKVAHGDFSVYVPTTNTSDKLDYLDVMIMDFNKMVEELGSIETLKTDFFSNVSHEIKTPLAVIQSNAELLQKSHLNEEEQKECTETILHATKRLSNLITNMLKLNKLEKQAIQPIPHSFDLCSQLCECALQFENIWEKKNIEFEADLEDKAMVETDEELLAIVWTNLLSNALKFTPDGGTVTLTQTSDEESVTVSVSDTGCGMDENTVKHIFDKNVSMYLDCYENFGWIIDENRPVTSGPSHTTIHLKRDRHIVNKAELTRLQRHFEACANEIRTLERSKASSATIWALIVGIIGRHLWQVLYLQ